MDSSERTSERGEKLAMIFIEAIKDRLKDVNIKYVEHFEPKAVKEEQFYQYSLTEHPSKPYSVGYQTTVEMRILTPDFQDDIIGEILSRLGRGTYGNAYVQMVEIGFETPQEILEGLYIQQINLTFTWEALQ